nr:DUF4157 domain-containing protein [Desulfocapsaceae bacterium]
MESKQLTKRKRSHQPRDAARARARRKLRTPAYLHRKLQVSNPQDKEEREADAVANEIKRNTASQPEEEQIPAARKIARQTGEMEEEEAAQTKLSRQAEEEEEEAQTKLQRQTEEEEEAQTKLWRQPAEEEKEEAAQPKLRRQVEDEEEIQAKLWRQPAEEEEEELQTKLRRQAEEETEPEEEQETSAELLEQRIQNSRGNGNPLPDTVLKDMEQQFGRDFSHVVIHNDNEAAEICEEINARAFTIGNDIYFALGEFTPETEGGRELLAHELAHVMQQNDRIHRKSKEEGGEGTYTRGSGVIIFDNINIPSNYQTIYSNKTPLIRHRAFSAESRTTVQQQTWKNDIDKGGSTEKLNNVLSNHPNVASAPPQRYIFKVPSPHQQIDGSSPRYAMGSLEDCARELSIPSWNHSGRSVTPSRESRLTSYDVDHIVEEQ